MPQLSHAHEKVLGGIAAVREHPQADRSRPAHRRQQPQRQGDLVLKVSGRAHTAPRAAGSRGPGRRWARSNPAPPNSGHRETGAAGRDPLRPGENDRPVPAASARSWPAHCHRSPPRSPVALPPCGARASPPPTAPQADPTGPRPTSAPGSRAGHRRPGISPRPDSARPPCPSVGLLPASGRRRIGGTSENSVS